MKKIVSCVLLISLIVSCLCSCAKQKERYTETFINYFDTASTIVGFEYDMEVFNANCEFIEKELKEYNNLYDIYKSYEGINNIRTINQNAGKEPVKVDKKIIDLLEYCIELYTTTNGKTNVAMGSVLSIWHNYREIYGGEDEDPEATLPPMEDLKEAAKHTDINNIVINKENNTVFLKDKDMSLDVGAVAKGYATEQIAKALEAKGVTNYTLNIGGNIRTIGPKGDGTPWITAVAMSDTTGNGENTVRVKLDGQAFVTSGTYQRYYMVDGVAYHHIIDPQTLMPKFDFISISICCKDSGLADALSTAIFNMSEGEGMAFINSLDGVEAMWITSDGRLLYSENFNRIIYEE
ncbi:MAG: FAD:protein FMN transferase [Clostridia bacterium]|nr:FAD:protein FMN transferase [Clostridia bacterium]